MSEPRKSLQHTLLKVSPDQLNLLKENEIRNLPSGNLQKKQAQQNTEKSPKQITLPDKERERERERKPTLLRSFPKLFPPSYPFIVVPSFQRESLLDYSFVCFSNFYEKVMRLLACPGRRGLLSTVP